MDFNPFTMPYLESLSTGELAQLAGRNGLDIPHGLERVFIIGELLELGRARRGWESGEVAEMSSGAPAGEFFGGLAALPEQYGASYVDVLIRDPLWVFAFWEVKRLARDPQGEDANPGERFLRIVPLRGEGMQPDTSASFTVAVGEGDRSLYLGIPHDGERCFRVDLCLRQDGACSVLAASRPFRLPRLIDSPSDAARGDEGVQAAYRNPLSGLSGAGSFPLVRSVDRLHRCKGA